MQLWDRQVSNMNTDPTIHAKGTKITFIAFILVKEFTLTIHHVNNDECNNDKDDQTNTNLADDRSTGVPKWWTGFV